MSVGSAAEETVEVGSEQNTDDGGSCCQNNESAALVTVVEPWNQRPTSIHHLTPSIVVFAPPPSTSSRC